MSKFSKLESDPRRACRHWRNHKGLDIWACYGGPRLTLKALMWVGAKPRSPKKTKRKSHE